MISVGVPGRIQGSVCQTSSSGSSVPRGAEYLVVSWIVQDLGLNFLVLVVDSSFSTEFEPFCFLVKFCFSSSRLKTGQIQLTRWKWGWRQTPRALRKVVPTGDRRPQQWACFPRRLFPPRQRCTLMYTPSSYFTMVICLPQVGSVQRVSDAERQTCRAPAKAVINSLPPAAQVQRGQSMPPSGPLPHGIHPQRATQPQQTPAVHNAPLHGWGPANPWMTQHSTPYIPAQQQSGLARGAALTRAQTVPAGFAPGPAAQGQGQFLAGPPLRSPYAPYAPMQVRWICASCLPTLP